MQLPVQLDVLLLRQQMPDLLLRPGALVAARVVEQHGAGRGLLSIAGVPVPARLPEELREGQTLRLRVDEAGPERIVLRVADQPQVVPPPVIALPLPDGRSARIGVRERPAEGAGRDGAEPLAVSLSYESHALGRLDLRIELPRGAVSATVGASAGEPAERAERAAGRLREALARVTGRPARVSVVARHDPFEAYA